MEFGLGGSHAVVTGSATGIGLATARLLAAEGAVVGLLDRNVATLTVAVDEIVCSGGRAYPLKADVTDQAAVHRAFDAAIERAPVDILIANAGMYRFSATDETRSEEWDLMHGVNLRGAFLCIHAVLPDMKRRRSGVIICVASLAGRSGGLRAGTAYASSKAGLIGFCRTLALELGSFGIRVNCVNPGVIDTPMTRNSFPDEARRSIGDSHPRGRWGQPEEVAGAICFLASSSASWISGAQLDVNGGIWPTP